jgi:hypothetical protein
VNGYRSCKGGKGCFCQNKKSGNDMPEFEPEKPGKNLKGCIPAHRDVENVHSSMGPSRGERGWHFLAQNITLKEGTGVWDTASYLAPVAAEHRLNVREMEVSNGNVEC